MADETHFSSELSRELSLFHITMMGLGMMIGAGVFLGTGRSIAIVGPGGVLLTFALGGLVALFTAMSYAELSSAIPRAGGAYNFARVGFGRGTSFLAGWMEWFASSVAGALYSVCFATYTMRFLVGLQVAPESAEEIGVKVVAVLVAALFIYINYRGASETGRVGAIITLGQTGFLVMIGLVGVVVALRHPDRLANFRPFLNPDAGWSALLVTMGITAVAFEGYEVIAQAGDETIDPKRNIPKAMLYAVMIVTLTYVGCAIAAIVAVKAGPDIVIDGKAVAPWQWIGHYGGKGFGVAVERLIPRWGGLVVLLAVISASTSALNATIYSATRASYAMGRDRLLPSMFAGISRRNKTPWVALMFTGAIVLIVSTCLNVEQVTESASIMFLFLFLLVNLCVIRVRYNMRDELDYGYLMPFFPVLPIVAILCQVVLAVSILKVGWTAWVIAVFWVSVGAMIYKFYSRSRVIATEDEIRIIEEEAAPDGDEYRIMVALANPDNALSLVTNTYTLCGAKRARVELLHMVQVPDQVPLSDAGQYMLEGKEAIGEVMLYLAPRFPSSSTIRYCRNVARGIVSAVREKNTDLLIMGWHGKSGSRKYRLGSTVDPVVERVPCNVVIFKDCGEQKYGRILVPVAGGPNSQFALEIAGIIAARSEGRIVVFTVMPPGGGSRFDPDRFIEENVERIAVGRDRVTVRTAESRRVVDAIVNEIDDGESACDLVVMGCTREPLLRRMTGRPVPETVAAMCRKPLVMVNASTGIDSWVKRWF